MPEGPEISFVTWPDGKVDERSLTVCGEQIARHRFVGAFLPDEWFGGNAVRYAGDALWNGARARGFRSYTIKIGEDGQPSLTK